MRPFFVACVLACTLAAAAASYSSTDGYASPSTQCGVFIEVLTTLDQINQPDHPLWATTSEITRMVLQEALNNASSSIGTIATMTWCQLDGNYSDV